MMPCDKLINMSESSVLNGNGDLHSLLSPGPSGVSSIDDEQLLFHWKFNELINLEGISISTPKPDGDRAPKTIKLYVNQPTMTFDDVDSLPPAQIIEVLPNNLRAPTSAAAAASLASISAAIIPLKKVKFLRVFDLAVFC